MPDIFVLCPRYEDFALLVSVGRFAVERCRLIPVGKIDTDILALVGTIQREHDTKPEEAYSVSSLARIECFSI